MSEILKDQKLRNSEYYGKQATYDELYAKSQQGVTFKFLYKKIIDEDNLLLAYRNIKKNGGSKTEGADGINIEDISKLLQWLREHPVIGGRASVEYNDNRISLYVAQKGKCAITGIELEAWDIHCHHKIPYSISKDDSYSNLIIVSQNVHKLIHAKRDRTIKKYLSLLKLDKKQLSKLNLLRNKAELDAIAI